MEIGPIADPVALRLPVDPVTSLLFALAFFTAATLTRRRPALGVALLVLAIPFDFLRDVGPTTITLGKVALLGLLAGLALRRASVRPLLARETLIVGAGGLAVTLATAISIHAADFHGPAIRESLKALQYLVTFCAVVLALRDAADDVALPRAMLLVTASVSVFAIAQLLTGSPSGVWFSGYAIPRIAGPLEGPNQLSGFLGIALPVVLAIALGPERGVRERRFALATLALGAAAVVLTLSRAGLPSTVAALAIVVWLAPARGDGAARRPVLLALGGGVAAGVGALGFIVLVLTHSFSVFDAVLGHFGTASEVEHAGSVGNRSILWHAALALWRAHPIFGVGAGNFEFEIGRVGPPHVRTHANSLYLQALAEGGIVLFVATVGSIAATLTVLVRSLRRSPRDALVLGIACGLGGLAAHQIFDLLVFFPKIGEFAAVVTGVAVARILATRPLGPRRSASRYVMPTTPPRGSLAEPRTLLEGIDHP